MRKFKSLITVLAITVTSAALFTGCGNTGSNDSNSSSQLQDESKQTQYPVTITTYDASGNEVNQTFDKAPERIVTNNLSATETLIELGLGDKIVGMMNPDNEVTSIYKDSIANINKLGDKKTISKEIVLSAMPDIIVGRAAMFSDKSLGEYTEWNANGVEVYAQAASVTKGETKIESVIQDVKNLGVIFNVQDKADSYADELQKKYDSVMTSLGNTGTDKKNALVMCAFDGNTFGTYKSSLQENMLNKLGYTNVSTGTSGLSLETLVTMNPELIVYVTSDRNAKNDADAMVFQTEKAMEEAGDKIDANDKTAVEADLNALKDILAKCGNTDEISDAQIQDIKAAKEKLMQSAQKLFAKMYEQAQAQGGAQGGSNEAYGDDVVDGDYREV